MIKDFKGAIFDLDGTVLDSNWVWEQIDIDFLGARGIQVPEDYMETIAHLGADATAVYTIERFGLNEKPEDLVAEWISMAKEAYAEKIICKPYAKEYIKKLYNEGVKLAVATSSDRELFMATLEREGIMPYFSEIVTVGEVKRGKGFPDVYEEAARRLGEKPVDCVVFEDILKGVEGAKIGNFKVVAVYDYKSAHNRKQMEQLADCYIEEFKQLMEV